MSGDAKSQRPDMTMLALVLLLVVFGLVILFSTSEYNGRVRFHDSAYYFKKQLFATALGLAAMYAVSRMDYRFFTSLAPAAYLFSMLLSTAVLLFGQEINGSKRWLNLGPLSFQPSEFAKVAVILFLAWQIDRTEKDTSGFLVYVPHYADTASDCRSGRFQQLKYRDHHSGNRGNPDFCIKSEVYAVYRIGRSRHRLCGFISGG